MVVLDTDHMTLVELSGSAPAERLEQRLRQLPKDEKTTTIVCFEEQTRGWLAKVARARKLTQQVADYKKPSRHLDVYRRIIVLDFDELAATEYERLQNMRLRIGHMDLKIASIALVHNATLLSRNLSDFRQVPGLRVEDWTL